MSNEERLDYTLAPSPVGPLLMAGRGGRLRLIAFATGPADAAGARPEPWPAWQRNDAAFADAVRQIEEYFAGARQAFDLPLDATGTPFQRRVHVALRHIPYGETRSYSDIAAAIGRPRAVRAVGAANARNPLPIVVPCHRVIGKGGALTGFGGGLPAKRHLLALERRVAEAVASE